jgi:hypothetical protein
VVEADPYIDGTTLSTDGGAFEVTLWTTKGAMVEGENQMWIRVAMPDPMVGDEARGIPNADITLDAWMPNAEHDSPTEPIVTYVTDGQYRIDNVELDHQGVWQLDFDIEVGKTIDEQVSFVFMLNDD